jgi:urease accessory protein
VLPSYAAGLVQSGRTVLGPDAVVAVTGQVLLGLAGEEPSRCTGTTRIAVDGQPVLHTTIELGLGAPAWLPPVVPRAYASTVHLGSEPAEVLGVPVTHGRMPA